MPRLLLLRHAKSSWGDVSLDDFDRPLNSRGRSAAPLMGQYMARNGLEPDQIISSSSRRTRETLAEIIPFFRSEQTVRFLNDFYYDSEFDYVDLIKTHANGARSLMVIGHNPAVHDTALALIGNGSEDLVDAVETKYPTAALTVIDFPQDEWADIARGEGRLVDFIRPRDLVSADDAGL